MTNAIIVGSFISLTVFLLIRKFFKPLHKVKECTCGSLGVIDVVKRK